MAQVINFPKRQRYWNPRAYDVAPQSGDETPDGIPTLLSVEAIVEGILRHDANCLEWCGYPIHIKSPLAAELDPEKEARCTGCNKLRPLEDFYRDARKSNQRYSVCKACHIEYRKANYHQGKLRKWGRAA